MRYLLLLLLTLSPLFGERIIEDQSGLTILTPTLADQKILKLELDNGLQVYLISDPSAHTSGAALAVHVGSWEDPAPFPGMAHFVEHMLFLGTKAFPDEEDFQRYLAAYEGKQNAFTANDRTVYCFSTASEGFLGALERFSHFFIDPLFTDSAIQRERLAIDQEFAKDVALDPWRFLFVRKELANASHPFHGFCIGNKSTLGEVTHSHLESWFESHYSAPLMRLVVYSQLPLEELKRATSRFFSSIPDRKLILLPPTVPLLSKQNATKLVTIVPLQEVQRLDLIWELPVALGGNKEVQADELVSSALGHEGEGSLLEMLKKENLASDLSVGSSYAGRDQKLFTLSIELTPEGVAHYERVMELSFSALAALKLSGVPAHLFDELVARKTLTYSYQRRKEVFTQILDLAADLVEEPLATFPKKTLMPTRYDKQEVEKLLSLLHPRNCHITLVAKKEALPGGAPLKERWMEVSYGLTSLTEGQLKKWSSVAASKDFHPPAPNRFLPKKIEAIVAQGEPSSSLLPEPTLLVKKEGGYLYYAKDDRFLVPELSLTFLLRTPLIVEKSALSKACADLYCKIIEDRLAPLAYEAKLGELKYSLESASNGLKLTLYGFSERARPFFEALIEPILALQPTEREFITQRDLLAKEYANSAHYTPLHKSLYTLYGLLYEHKALPQLKGEATQALTYAQFKEFCSTLWQEFYIEGVAYGYLEEAEARGLFERLEAKQREIYPVERHENLALNSLEEQQDPLYLMRECDLPGNAVILAADCGPFSFKRYAALEILSKGLEEPFFSELRTRQQTGYLVRNTFREMERGLFAFFLVQSNTHDPRDLLARFELFLEGALQTLTSSAVTEERFETMRAACITHLTHLAEGMPSMGELLSTLSFEYGADFQWVAKRIEALHELTYEEFVQCAQEFLGRENHKRLAICMRGSLPKENLFQYKRIGA